MARLIRTFMAHVKSSSLTQPLLDAKLSRGPERLRTPRTRLFLDLYWQIHQAWQERLDAESFVDFEDMLVEAAIAIEKSQVTPGYDLVMVDEFQDASQARARLTSALVRGRGKYLLAAGDDWQSINRFAGADISVMTRFERWFGRGQTLRLQTTFRSPQSICDVASSFVSKNPRQLVKQVTSSHRGPGASVRLLYVDVRHDVKSVLARYLDELVVRAKPALWSRRPSVDVLGRYGFDRNLVPRSTPPELDVNFRTVHKAKGLEADYVVLPNVSRGIYGFPSQIADDPVLDLVMADPDDYPHAEERRLFYVALTRARREVVLIAERGRESPFVTELTQDEALLISGSDGLQIQVVVCPSCGDGTLVARTGPYGDFLGCSTFPWCRHTQPRT